ncbi:MAG TPA: SpoIIE family protein phosphatase [Terracidiphilus sp.]|nr:SpoIIE family protein phosphatase [Terracidiphilus sp.]
MEVAFTEIVAITDASSVGEARRSAATAAAKLGLSETRAGELAILATEVSRNVLNHGGGGQVIVAGVQNRVGPLAQILALDKGSGIENLSQAMSDGYSTGGTMGTGLGAMKRMASRFEVFTGRGGTIVLLEVGSATQVTNPQAAAVALPYPGERVCGDGWYCDQTPERTVALLTDGLGHGLPAAEAAQEAIATFQKHLSLNPAEILGYLHDALKKTRGAVAAVVEIRPPSRKLTYAGVGNISASMVSGGASRSLVSHNGTLGMTVHRIQEFSLEWAPDSVFVMHSDGLQTRWDLTSYSGLLSRHPALICGTLIRDFRRHRDDASVMVFKAA